MTNAPLNPFELSQILGGVMVPGRRAGFGGFSLVRTANAMREGRPQVVPDISFSDEDDEVIRKTFERVRNGLAVDRFLADPEMAEAFADACRAVGVRQSNAAINRRLLAMRKATGGGRLGASTRTDRHFGLIERLGAGVEAALVKVSARFGASVDDVLADAEVGSSFESIARRVSSGGTPLEYRICALQIRKRRHPTDAIRVLFDKLESVGVREQFHEVGANTERTNLRSRGFVLLSEADRPLYLGRFAKMSDGVKSLSRSGIVSALAEGSMFWQPDPSTINVKVAALDELPDAPANAWELCLIRDWRPVFNYPVKSGRAA